MNQQEWEKNFQNHMVRKGGNFAEAILEQATNHIDGKYPVLDKSARVNLIAAYVNAASHYLSGTLAEPKD